MSQPDSAPKDPDEPGADRVIAIGRATLRNVDFRKVRFDRFSLTGCLFLSCDFRGLRLDASFQPLFSASPRSYFRDCHFDGADLRRVRPEHARFERCTFDDANLDGWHADRAEFVECRFAGRLGRVIFAARPSREGARATGRRSNDFRGNDFIDADLDGVTFVGGIDLDQQRLPPSDERVVRLDRFEQRTASARREVRRWDYPEERREALAMLDALRRRYDGQPDVIAARISRTGPSARVQVRLWALLERAL